MQGLAILNTRILSWGSYVQAGGGGLYRPSMSANPDNPGLTLGTLGQPLTLPPVLSQLGPQANNLAFHRVERLPGIRDLQLGVHACDS